MEKKRESERHRGKQMNRERRKRVSQAIDLVGKAKEILDEEEFITWK